VTAINAVGTGAASPPSNTVTPAAEAAMIAPVPVLDPRNQLLLSALLALLAIASLAGQRKMKR